MKNEILPKDILVENLSEMLMNEFTLLIKLQKGPKYLWVNENK